jgi:hypothetical protein
MFSTQKIHISKRIEMKFDGHLPLGPDRTLGNISKNQSLVSAANLL